MRLNISIGLLLAGITFALYWPVRNFDLILNDDPAFLTYSPEIRSGVTGHSLRWIMTGVVAANWHPVTNLSFVLGHQLWGSNPGAEHLVNAAFHALNAALLFLVLLQLTQSPWRSAVVAALFAWHPLRVESVAWIAERKDVLSVFFFFLTLWAYARYAQGTGIREQGGKTTNNQHPTSNIQWKYWLAVFFFALGLMSKAMVVTLPFVLLLLDVWPLKRVAGGGWRVAGGRWPAFTSFRRDKRVASDGRQVTGGKKNASRPSTFNPQPSTLNSQLSTLLLEKWPFFVLAVAFSVITFMVQRGEAATPSLAQLGLELRLENIVASYVRYLAWTAWPANLAAFYSFPFDHHFYLALWPGWVTAMAAVLLAGISVLCLNQIARRPYLAIGWFWYLGTLVPVIGLVQVGGQGMADRYTYIPLIGPVISLVWLVAEKWPAKIVPRALLATVTAVVLAGCLIQTRHQLQFWQNTELLSEHTIDVTGENPRTEYILGLGLEQKGDIRGALIHYRNALTSQTSVIAAHYAMGRLLNRLGQWADAARIYSGLLTSQPDDFTCHLGLANVLPHLGRNPEALTHLKAAMQTCPDTPDALNNLAWTLAASGEAEFRDGTQAIKYAQRACELTHYRETMMVGTLAAAYAEAGRFEEAIATAQKACTLASESGQPDLVQKNQELLELYRQHQPYHEPANPIPTYSPATIAPANDTETTFPHAP